MKTKRKREDELNMIYYGENVNYAVKFGERERRGRKLGTLISLDNLRDIISENPRKISKENISLNIQTTEIEKEEVFELNKIINAKEKLEKMEKHNEFYGSVQPSLSQTTSIYSEEFEKLGVSGRRLSNLQELYSRKNKLIAKQKQLNKSSKEYKVLSQEIFSIEEQLKQTKVKKVSKTVEQRLKYYQSIILLPPRKKTSLEPIAGPLKHSFCSSPLIFLNPYPSAENVTVLKKQQALNKFCILRTNRQLTKSLKENNLPLPEYLKKSTSLEVLEKIFLSQLQTPFDQWKEFIQGRKQYLIQKHLETHTKNMTVQKLYWYLNTWSMRKLKSAFIKWGLFVANSVLGLLLKVVIKLQRQYRRKLDSRLEEKTKAAIFVQKQWKRKLGWKRVVEREKRRKRDKGVIHVQASWRRWLGNRIAELKRIEKVLEVAIVILQSCIRGWLIRRDQEVIKSMWSRRLEMAKEEAAIMIQGLGRRKLATGILKRLKWKRRKENVAGMLVRVFIRGVCRVVVKEIGDVIDEEEMRKEAVCKVGKRIVEIFLDKSFGEVVVSRLTVKRIVKNTLERIEKGLVREREKRVLLIQKRSCENEVVEEEYDIGYNFWSGSFEGIVTEQVLDRQRRIEKRKKQQLREERRIMSRELIPFFAKENIHRVVSTCIALALKRYMVKILEKYKVIALRNGRNQYSFWNRAVLGIKWTEFVPLERIVSGRKKLQTANEYKIVSPFTVLTNDEEETYLNIEGKDVQKTTKHLAVRREINVSNNTSSETKEFTYSSILLSHASMQPMKEEKLRERKYPLFKSSDEISVVEKVYKQKLIAVVPNFSQNQTIYYISYSVKTVTRKEFTLLLQKTNQLKQETLSANIIQRFFKIALAKNKLYSLKQQHYQTQSILRKQAVVTLQAYRRGIVQRRNYSSLKQRINPALLVIHCFIRYALAQKKISELRKEKQMKEKKELEAVVSLQCFVRKTMAIRRVFVLREDKRKADERKRFEEEERKVEMGILRFQCIWRGRRERKIFEKRLEERRKEVRRREIEEQEWRNMENYAKIIQNRYRRKKLVKQENKETAESVIVEINEEKPKHKVIGKIENNTNEKIIVKEQNLTQEKVSDMRQGNINQEENEKTQVREKANTAEKEQTEKKTKSAEVKQDHSKKKLDIDKTNKSLEIATQKIPTEQKEEFKVEEKVVVKDISIQTKDQKTDITNEETKCEKNKAKLIENKIKVLSNTIEKEVEYKKKGDTVKNKEQVWIEYFDRTYGVPYYHNKETGETTWINPISTDPPPPIHPPPQYQYYSPWEEYYDDTYQLSYYYNTLTQETSWEPPQNFISKYTNPSIQAPRYY
eukprot:snap_masked-scaffold_28-processed-gene-2.34-mRNA-1 protein AED:1.00 eAED:1.00 QI:0/-1/0/0/-1/1/1/0/1333